jgi:ABC-type enterochelin transport system permease subunit
MLKTIQEKIIKNKYTFWEMFKDGFIAGLGWSFGVTVGLVLISTLIIQILNNLGGLPFIGSFIANIVQATQQQLLLRNVINN